MTAAKKRVLGLSLSIGNRSVAIQGHVAAFTFSDTLLLFTRDDQEDDLCCILTACLELLAQNLSGSIPARIGISHGLFVFNGDESLFVGPPLIRAYERGEAAQWLGAVLDDVTAERARRLTPEFASVDGLPLVVNWDVPEKEGHQRNAPVLCWPRSHRRNFQVPLPITYAVLRAFRVVARNLSTNKVGGGKRA